MQDPACIDNVVHGQAGRVFERVPGTSVWWPHSPHSRGEQVPGIIVAGFAAPLSFINAYRFRRDMLLRMPSP